MEKKEHDAVHRRRSYDDEFKRGAVRLVSEEGYTFKAASAAVNVGEQSLRVKDTEKWPLLWRVKHGLVHIKGERGPPEGPYHLLVCYHPFTDEIKYFLSNAPADTPVKRCCASPLVDGTSNAVLRTVRARSDWIIGKAAAGSA